MLVHTEVPDEWGGRGIGGRLVRAALAPGRGHDLIVVPWCPFARRWLHEHPDEAAAVTIDWDTPRPPVMRPPRPDGGPPPGRAWSGLARPIPRV